jgi:hypothetical protein
MSAFCHERIFTAVTAVTVVRDPDHHSFYPVFLCVLCGKGFDDI